MSKFILKPMVVNATQIKGTIPVDSKLKHGDWLVDRDDGTQIIVPDAEFRRDYYPVTEQAEGLLLLARRILS